ncbi:hypothetical protein [Enhygromyxa salina]|uniref:Uncharacterized protein n=1 Tax=Enhygromyxa salina TaxID=215803 RepID=A0A2S9YRA8_9BACT|nr:hypothetical protein [Enhygromyxa salina]PRQ07634.1 hypothetical protein ENSA7_26240 [Enhygromyxa salina]
MLEIARLLENALANNRSGLRKAAKQTLAKAPLITTIRELLASEAGDAMRELTLSDLEDALIAAGAGAKRGAAGQAGHASPARAHSEVDTKPATSADSQSREEYMYRRILEVLTDTPSLTIGQLAKRIEVDTIELRGYLSWMRRVGKVSSIGRARATRYSLPDGVVAAG